MTKTKEELLVALEEHGITLTSGIEIQTPLTGKETIAQLVKILKTVEKAAGESDSEEEIQPVNESDTISIICPGTVQFGPKAGYVRTFSKEAHGESFQEEAEKFRKRYDGSVVKDIA